MRSTIATVPVALLWGLLALAASGCFTSTKELPAERVVEADNERVLWDALRVAIYESDYQVGGGANPSTRTIQSAWKLDLQPYKSQGYRTRVIASYRPTETPSSGPLESFDVSIRVEKETNESYRSLDPTFAKWEPADDDLSTARRIMQRFHGLLGTEGIDVTPEPKRLGTD